VLAVLLKSELRIMALARSARAVQRLASQSAGMRYMSATPLNVFTEDEMAIREAGEYFAEFGFKKYYPTVHSPNAVAKFAKDILAPEVRRMDDEAKIDPKIFQGMFEQGVSGQRKQ